MNLKIALTALLAVIAAAAVWSQTQTPPPPEGEACTTCDARHQSAARLRDLLSD